MVVFSDLDRSIIYSKEFIQEESNTLDIEIYKGENISYISQKTIENIKKIKKNSDFIPTTTRTIEQFKRINFKKYGLDFKHAITSNGGNILINGEVDIEYKYFIEEKLKLSSYISDIIKLFKEYKNIDGIKKFRVAENLFFYIVVNEERFDLNNLNSFTEKIRDLNWDVYMSGRKIYFLPREIKKSTAVKYICDKYGYKNTFAIGDSTMDSDMLNFCDYSYILRHGDFVNYIKKGDKFIISDKKGFEGSEEILDKIILCQNILNF